MVVRTLSACCVTLAGSEGAMGNWRERWGDERLEAALDLVTLVWIAIAVALLVVDLLF